MSIPRQPLIIIVGTRPEGIKMIPVYKALQEAHYPVLLCSTMQHSELLQDVFDVFGVQPDINLNIMRLDQDLFYLTQSILQKTKRVFSDIHPSLVLVQGDTTSTLAAALSAFYLKIPVLHVEAGLRTGNMAAPFPEEMNRRVVSSLASFHCAPTQSAIDNLRAEGIAADRIFLTGNTVVDALRIVSDSIAQQSISLDRALMHRIEYCKQNNQRIMLLTVHRRESFGKNIENIFTAIKNFLQQRHDVVCIYPYHPNPQVICALEVTQFLSLPNVYSCEPLLYKNLVAVLRASKVIITDSGGIQEEAVSLGKQVIVLRDVTERMEGVRAGVAHVVGADPEKITNCLMHILQTDEHEQPLQLYGDGYAAQKVVEVIAALFHKQILLDAAETSRRSLTHKVISNTTMDDKNRSVHHIQQTLHNNKKDGHMKKVCVIGLGYIGLPTAIVLADSGFDVIGFDIDIQKVQKINQGDPVIQEPEVYEKLQVVLGSKQLQAVISLAPADYFIVAVPTPLKKDNQADTSYVVDAAERMSAVLKKGNVVIIESTVPVGTTGQIALMLEQKSGLKVGKDIFVAYCPERVLPGKIFQELIENSRIIGGVDRTSVEQAKQLYATFVQGSLYLTDATTAEMVKLVENSSRDVEIAFAHQVASMADAAGLNPYEVIELANKHPRVNILQPSAGVGGHCIAIDPWFLVETFKERATLLHTARRINDERPLTISTKIEQAIAAWQKDHKGSCTVALMGATYKPDVDDLRESPALTIIKSLITQNSCSIIVCEPHVHKSILIHHVGERLVSVSEGIERADIIVYLVAHRRFKAIDQKLLSNKLVLDYCGLLHKHVLEAGKQEYLFWPARSILDIFISNQEPSQEHNP